MALESADVARTLRATLALDVIPALRTPAFLVLDFLVLDLERVAGSCA
jgi:hypothetical protein